MVWGGDGLVSFAQVRCSGDHRYRYLDPRGTGIGSDGAKKIAVSNAVITVI
jgi:hypothetical protein